MNQAAKLPRIYDPAEGRPRALEQLILQLGIEALAKRYGVRPATVRGWLRGEHKPSRRTLERAGRKLF